MSTRPWEGTLRGEGPDSNGTRKEDTTPSRVQEMLAWRARKDGLGTKPLSEMPLKIKGSFKPDDPAVIRRKHDDRLSATYKKYLETLEPAEAIESPPEDAQRTEAKISAPRKQKKARTPNNDKKSQSSNGLVTPPSRKKIAIKLNFDSPEIHSDDDGNNQEDDNLDALSSSAGMLSGNNSSFEDESAAGAHVKEGSNPLLQVKEGKESSENSSKSKMSGVEYFVRIILSLLFIGIGIVAVDYSDYCGEMLRMRVNQLFTDSRYAMEYAVQLNSQARSMEEKTSNLMNVWSLEMKEQQMALTNHLDEARDSLIELNHKTAEEIQSALGSAVDTFRSAITESVEMHVKDIVQLTPGSSLPDMVQALSVGFAEEQGNLTQIVNTFQLHAQKAEELREEASTLQVKLVELNSTLEEEQEITAAVIEAVKSAPPVEVKPWDLNDYFVLAVILVAGVISHSIYIGVIQKDRKIDADQNVDVDLSSMASATSEDDDESVVFIPMKNEEIQSPEITPQDFDYGNVTPVGTKPGQRLSQRILLRKAKESNAVESKN